MTYQGSKAKYSKYICPILQNCIDKTGINTYVEPFVGGANIIKNIKNASRFASDNNKYLIALWKELQSNSNFDFPSYPNREDWDRCKNGEEERDWYVGFVSIFCSNMTGGFPAGYDRYGLRYNGRINNCKKDLPLVKDIHFNYMDYKDMLERTKNAIIYCDPPYANTHKYNYQKFDTITFWEEVRKSSLYNYIFISEQKAPEDFIPIWSLDIKHNIRGNIRMATENLFIYNKGLAFNFYKNEGI